jgi:CIC family chloride channel protein
MAEYPARLLRRLPKQAQTITATTFYALAASLGAVAFQYCITIGYRAGIVRLSHQRFPIFLAGTLVLLVTTSLLVGWLLNSFCPDAAGSGIPQLKIAFWKDFGYVPWRTVWVKFVAGVLSIAGGSSLGREGPSVHFAGGLGSVLGGFFGEPKQNRRRAAAAGAAAGLAAAFNTPIAAITFVLEEIIEDLNSRFLGSVLLASVLGAMVVHGLVGPQPAFSLGGVRSPTWLGYLLLPLVSALASVSGIIFQRGTLWLRPKVKALVALPKWCRPTLGALVAWLLGAVVFRTTGHLGVFSLGYDDLSEALSGNLAWHMAFVLLAAKLVATIACYGFGGCGGIFSPTLFFGGMAGIAFSGLLARGLPLTDYDQIALGIVGMSSCLGAVVGAPVTGILIVFEMTHEFSMVPALMLGALVSQSARRVFSPKNFYESILLQDGHQLDQVIPPRDLADWQQLPVSAIANFKPIALENLDASYLGDLLERFTYSRFPVLQLGEIRGTVSRAECLAALRENRQPQVRAAKVVAPRKPIREAQTLLMESEDSVLLVRDETSGKLIALLTLHDLLRAQEAFVEKKR